jgi:hypothetical protein
MTGSGKTFECDGVAFSADNLHVLYAVGPTRYIKVRAGLAQRAFDRMLGCLWKASRIGSLLDGRKPFLDRNKFATPVYEDKWNLMYARAATVWTLQRGFALILLLKD